MSERLDDMRCVLDPLRVCTSECGLYTEVKKATEIMAGEDGISIEECVASLRIKEATYLPRDRELRIFDRIQVFEKAGGNVEDCLRFKNRNRSEQ